MLGPDFLENIKTLRPRPFQVHVSSILGAWSSALSALDDGDLLRKSGYKFPNNTINHARFKEAVSVAIADKWKKFLFGVNKYRNSPRDYQRMYLKQYRRIIWRDEDSSVFTHSYLWPFTPKAVMLFISAPMNNPNIFNISENGLAREIQKLSILPLFLDWGTELAKKNYDFSTHIENILIPAYKFVCERFNLPVYLTGYCIGGIAICALSILSRNNDLLTKPKGSITLAMPWDFRNYHTTEQNMIDSFIDEYSLINDDKVILEDLLLTLLSALQPGIILEKFCKFAVETDENREKLFVEIEDWLNDVRPLSATLFKECLIDFFRKNLLSKGQYRLCGQIMDPRMIDNSVLVVNPTEDKIVPYSSTKSFVKNIRNCSSLYPETGHIGFLVGNKAQQQFVEPCINWLKTSLEE